jgi:D-amino peptidase
LEGIRGVDRYDSHEVKKVDYQKWKQHVGQLMFEEVHAVYEGLVSTGATEVIVFDSHSGDDTTLHFPQDLPKLTHVKRSNANRVQFPSFDSSIDGIILWGYHVKAGSMNGKLSHTNSRRVKHIKINNREVGEVYLHGLYAFCNGVPLIAVSGDDGLRDEVESDIGTIAFFNSEPGNNLQRKEYLDSIRKFILNLNFPEVLKINQALVWPTDTTMEVSYKHAFINIGRWLLRKQFKYTGLKDLFTCIYDKGSFLEQWNHYNGFCSLNGHKN